jgi:hypothetical protein
MRRNAVQEIMEERVVYGGLVASRWEVYQDLQAKNADNRIHWLTIDRLTFNCPVATPWDIEHRRTLQEIQERERCQCDK